MNKALKNIIGIVALPVAVGFSKVFCSMLSEVSYISSNMGLFLWGIILYMLMHILFWKPVYLYTLGHEAIHIIATWMCGGHVTSFSITNDGGSVTTSKTNVFIELSPYFVPIYTLVLIFMIPVVRYWFADADFFKYYALILGFSLGMHLIMTAEIIKLKQPDIANSGYAFSLTVIYVANLAIIFLVFSILIKELSFTQFVMKGLESSGDIYSRLWDRLVTGES
ncbi:MAG: hypothetical protein ABH885_01065 [Candidatus Omnitrophota bacterium]